VVCRARGTSTRRCSWHGPSDESLHRQVIDTKYDSSLPHLNGYLMTTRVISSWLWFAASVTLLCCLPPLLMSSPAATVRSAPLVVLLYVAGAYTRPLFSSM